MQHHHPEKKAAHVGRNQVLGGEAGAIGGDQSFEVVLDEIAVDEVAGRGDPIDQHHHAGDQHQVAALGYHLEAAEHAVGAMRIAMLDPARGRGHATVHERGEACGQQQQGEARQQQVVGAEPVRQLLAELGPGERAELGREHDHREQALAGLDVERVRRQRPELRQQHHVEDSDPDVEAEAHVDTAPHRDPEREQGRAEEPDHRVHQARPVVAPAHRAVERHQHHQDRRDRGRGVAALGGAAVLEQQPFAHRAEDVIGEQNQEHVRAEARNRASFARTDPGEQCEQALERRVVLVFAHRFPQGTSNSSFPRKRDL